MGKRILVLFLCASLSVTCVQALNPDDNDDYDDYPVDTLATTTSKDNITEDFALNQDIDKHEGNATEHAHAHHNETEAHGISLASWQWGKYSKMIYFNLVILVAALLKICFHHAHWLANHFPESCVLILTGIFGGAIIHHIIGSQNFPGLTSDLFFNVLLPPIILDAAYALYDEDFLANLKAILIYAVIGTIFNVFAIGFIIYGLSEAQMFGPFFNYRLSLLECLIFATAISAVDPVAVLAIFEEIGVNMVLYFLVFGESLLNDGVTIVIYNTVTKLNDSEEVTAKDYTLAVLSFFSVVCGGLLIGAIMGAVSALILRLTKEVRVSEPLVIYASAYFSFLLAETIHWSGIISIIACGIMQKRYTFLNASKKTFTTVKYSIKTFASTSDCIIFIFLGKVTMDTPLKFHWGFIAWTLVLCTVIRFIGVISLTSFINTRRVKKISFKEQLIMAYGGLRGAVGFSLAYIYKESWDAKIEKAQAIGGKVLRDTKNLGEISDVFLGTTLVVVFFTVFIQGGTIKGLVNALNITKKRKVDKREDKIFSTVHGKMTDHLRRGIQDIIDHRHTNMIIHVLYQFEKQYITKLLLSKSAFNSMTLKLERITKDEHMEKLNDPGKEQDGAEDEDEESGSESGQILTKEQEIMDLKAFKKALDYDMTRRRYRKRNPGEEEPKKFFEVVKKARAIQMKNLKDQEDQIDSPITLQSRQIASFRDGVKSGIFTNQLREQFKESRKVQSIPSERVDCEDGDAEKNL